MNNLYNKYRPHVLSEVIGQTAAKSTVKGMLANKNIPHANLFCGIHGTGKTTLARIIAKAINCENPTEDGPCCQCASCKNIDSGNNTDVIELDAASNNGVADIEQVIEKIQFLPYGNKKVLILDEVHMLSNAAFAKLLKTLEEPPEHVVFILCTTDSHKVPGTIHSRCVELNFKKVSDADIFHNLCEISKKEGFVYEEKALRVITRAANGSVRDSLSILEALALGEQLTEDKAIERLGFATDENLFSLLAGIADHNMALTVSYLESIMDNGVNVPTLLKDMSDILVQIIGVHTGMNYDTSIYPVEYMDRLVNSVSVEQANDYISAFCEVLQNGKNSGLELAFKLCVLKLVTKERDLSKLEDRVSLLEKELESIKNGVVAVMPVASTQTVKVSDTIVSNDRIVSNETMDTVLNEVTTSEEVSTVSSNGFVPVEINEVPFEINDSVPFEETTTTNVVTDTKEVVSEIKEELKEVSTSVEFSIPGGKVVSTEEKKEVSLPESSTESFSIPGGKVLATEKVVEEKAEKQTEKPKATIGLNDGFGSFGNFFPSFARQS